MHYHKNVLLEKKSNIITKVKKKETSGIKFNLVQMIGEYLYEGA